MDARAGERCCRHTVGSSCAQQHPCTANAVAAASGFSACVLPLLVLPMRRLKLSDTCTSATTFLGEPRAGQTNHDQCIKGELAVSKASTLQMPIAGEAG